MKHVSKCYSFQVPLVMKCFGASEPMPVYLFASEKSKKIPARTWFLKKPFLLCEPMHKKHGVTVHWFSWFLQSLRETVKMDAN